MDGTETPSTEAPAIDPTEAPDEYAIVEIFGHRRHAGRVVEIERYGTKLLRVDVPKEGDFARGFVSHFYGGSSIFSFTHCDLATVQRVNKPSAGYGTYSLPVLEDETQDEEPL